MLSPKDLIAGVGGSQLIGEGLSVLDLGTQTELLPLTHLCSQAGVHYESFMFLLVDAWIYLFFFREWWWLHVLCLLQYSDMVC